MDLRYVASGLSYVWLNNFTKQDEPELCVKIESMVDNLVASVPNHDYGTLFNGFVEKGHGQRTRDIFGKYPIQVDSGGLQIITLGKTITDELKDEVYRTQAKYGDIGMQFDEIPVKVVGETSNRTTMEGRFFDPSIFDDCARESGKNLRRQIEVFLEEKTDCKPMMIIQGNDQSYYQRWADVCLSEVPLELQEHICGISSGGAALGTGYLEDVERIWALHKLEVPEHMKKMSHMLGFGSMKRLVPLIEFSRNGAFKDTIVSYDSTKHTGSIARGQPQDGPKLVQMSRLKDNRFYEFLEKIGKVSREVLDFDFQEDHFYYTISQQAAACHEFYGGADKEIYQRNLHKFAFMLYGVWNVMHHLDILKKDPEHLKFLRKRDYQFLVPLKEIKTQADYDYWKRHVGRNLRSVPVPHESSSLEAFF